MTRAPAIHKGHSRHPNSDPFSFNTSIFNDSNLHEDSKGITNMEPKYDSRIMNSFKLLQRKRISKHNSDLTTSTE
jgi:hypothetical protein